MNLIKRISALLLAMLTVFSCAACTDHAPETGEVVDYAAAIKLDMTSDTAKQEVTVKTFIDGDTTHFHIPDSLVGTSVLKARYLAINTPESTGKIEEYGKAAARFTREKLESAASIIIESDNGTWNPDSTGGRYLVWVWYQPQDSAEYRNLNIEILQNGLAIASSSSNNRYGEICLAAIAQAKAELLGVHSGQKDPDFYYGEAVELTLKELRTNIEAYNGMKVAFKGVITMNNNNSVYVEDYDAETNMYYGMSVYYGYGLTGEGLDILAVGNESRIVGTVQYYEAGGTYQVSGLTYRLMRPDDPNNIRKFSDGHTPAYVPTTPANFTEGKIEVESNDTMVTFDYASLAMSTSIEMRDLVVKDIYTTTNEDSSSFGAMTLTCEADGKTISVRTVPLLDASGSLITADAYTGKTVDVRGIVDYYDGAYQIKVFAASDITIH